jgi:hypothetical protein
LYSMMVEKTSKQEMQCNTHAKFNKPLNPAGLALAERQGKAGLHTTLTTTL